MKNCEYWQQQISRLLDGDLSPEEEDALWEHIADCPDCARTFEEFSQQTSVLRAQVVRPPVDLSKLVMARIRTGQTDPASFQKQETKKPASHRLRSWRKVALAACFVAVVAVGAVAGVYGRGARLAGGAEKAEYLPEAQSDTIYMQLPEAGASQSSQSAPVEQPQTAAVENGTQALPAAPEDAVPPAADARSLPEPAPEAGAGTGETAQESTAPDAVDADMDMDAAPVQPEAAAADEQPVQTDANAGGSGSDSISDDGSDSDSGIMTIMEPAPAAVSAAEPTYIFTGSGAAAGYIADTGALRALLTGESWQGQAPAVLYTLSLDGTGYAFSQDEGGALLWQRAGDAGFTRSSASLAALEALIVK